MKQTRLDERRWYGRLPMTPESRLFSCVPLPMALASSKVMGIVDFKNSLFWKVPVVSPRFAMRSYTMHPGIGERVVDLLVKGMYPSRVARELNIAVSLEGYYRGRAIRDLVIARAEGSYPHVYKKGARYAKGLYKKRKGRRCPKFVIPEARAHAGNGDLFRIKAKEGDMHEVKVSTERIRLFPKEPVGKIGKRHYNGEIRVPANLLGYEGGKATLHFYPSIDAIRPGVLMVSPPEMHLNLDQIAAANAPELFTPILEYVRGLLEGHGGWRFMEINQASEIHYAFSRQMVYPLLPELMDTAVVKPLERGESETERILFIDQSVPGGELETTDLGIASDILAMLMVVYEAEISGGGAY